MAFSLFSLFWASIVTEYCNGDYIDICKLLTLVRVEITFRFIRFWILSIFPCLTRQLDRLCGLVVRVSGYRYRGLGFDSRRYQIFLSSSLLSLVSLVRSTEELLE